MIIIYRGPTPAEVILPGYEADDGSPIRVGDHIEVSDALGLSLLDQATWTRPKPGPKAKTTHTDPEA